MDIDFAIDVLVGRIRADMDPNDALKLTQAAQNLVNTKAGLINADLMALELADRKQAPAPS